MATINWRTKKRIQEEAIDAYEQEHHLGKYAPDISNLSKTVAPEFPDGGQAATHMGKLQDIVSTGIMTTDKEGTRQEFDMASVHLRIASRYLHKAFSI